MATESEESAEKQAATKEEVVPKYELMLILVPDLSQDVLDKELNKIKKLIKELKGEIYHEDNWEVRDLAYTIKKNNRGYYVIYYFTFEPSNLVELEKDLQLNQKVLRHLVVRSPKDYTIKKLSELELTEEDRIAMKKNRPQREKPGRMSALKSEPKSDAKPAAAKKEEPKAEKPVEAKSEKVEKAEPVKKVEEAPKEETSSKEEAPKKAESKDEKKTMDISDLDSQLESILDDPDMNIKL